MPSLLEKENLYLGRKKRVETTSKDNKSKIRWSNKLLSTVILLSGKEKNLRQSL